jgi:hypothetical protein
MLNEQDIEKKVKELIVDCVVHNDCFLNSVSHPKTENRTADTKKPRQYYTMYISPVPLGKSTPMNVFQGYDSDDNPVWKDSPAPELMAQFQGQKMSGLRLCELSLNISYEYKEKPYNKITVVVLPNEEFHLAVYQRFCEVGILSRDTEVEELPV